MEQSKMISEFNESMFQIQRLHNLWLQVALARQNGNFNRCKWLLDSIELELNYDAHRLDDNNRGLPNEESKYCNKIEKVNFDMDELSQGAKNFIKLYKLLKDKEKLLREVQQEAGKGARYKSEDEDTLL